MNTDKKPPTIEIGIMDKIMAATGIINYMAMALKDVEKDYAYLSSRNPESDIYLKGLKEHRAQLEITMSALRNVAEDLGNYLDGRDIVDPPLELISGAAFDILYDRIPNE